MVHIMILTPQEYMSRCTEFRIIYGRHPSPFGECLIGITGLVRVVCFLWFIDDNYEYCLQQLKKEWPNSVVIENPYETAVFAERIFSTTEYDNVGVVLRGSEFQIKVWNALLEIPRGMEATYSDIAEVLGISGIRATVNAIRANRIAYIIPCHRITSIAGEVTYRWGLERREQIMQFEQRHR